MERAAFAAGILTAENSSLAGGPVGSFATFLVCTDTLFADATLVGCEPTACPETVAGTVSASKMPQQRLTKRIPSTLGAVQRPCMMASNFASCTHSSRDGTASGMG